MQTRPIIESLFISLILLVLVFPGCSADREMRHAFGVEEIDGIPTAVNRGEPRFTGELFTYEEILTLKQDEGNPESLLNDPFSFTMDGDGNFYVEDYSNNRIAVFDLEGNYVRSIGRQGDGPGELNRTWRLLSLRGDRITAYESMKMRTTIFRTDGTVEEIFTIPKAVSYVSSMFRTPDNNWVALNNIFREQGKFRYERNGFTTITAELDTLGSAETEELPTFYRYTMALEVGGEVMEVPSWMVMIFAPQPDVEYVPGTGVLLSTGKEPLLSWYRLDGTCYRRIRLDISVRPLTEKEKSSYLARLDSSIEEQPEGRLKQSLLNARKEMVFTETKGCWSSVTVDDAGYIWLKVPESREERQEAGGGYLYRLLNPDGEYLGMTRLPEEGRIKQGNLMAIATDPETDEEIPTVWRLVPQPEGFTYP